MSEVVAAAPVTYVAFLRAINVGGRTIRMAELRAIVAEIGFANVDTFIASGNVIFDVPSGDTRLLEQRLERHLEASLGYEVITFIRSTREIADIVRTDPFSSQNDPDSAVTVHVAFLKEAPDADAVEALLAYRSEVDDFTVAGREAY